MLNLFRHRRFLLAMSLGFLILMASTFLKITPVEQALLAFDGFALIYLVLMVAHACTSGADDLRRHAETDDEGIAVIVMLAVGAVVTSFGAIWLVLREASLMGAGLALLAVPLGWAAMHTLIAFRYAHLNYAPGKEGGLGFPGDAPPGSWDFLYFAFTLGMTAQTSDVIVTSSRLRRMVLVHAVASFFYNTVILALAVNAGLMLAK